MTILMDDTTDNSSRDRVQRLYNKNVELENRRWRSAQARVPSDPNTWQQMRENYEAIILEDHAFSEQHEIEYALWQLHYRRIEELRAHYSAAQASTGSNGPQGGKTHPRPDRITKIRSQFKIFLSEATGFYHDLMLKIRAKYGLPLGYFSDDPDNEVVTSKDGNKSSETKKGLISCHRCLIYLGDLARYKGSYGEGDSKTRDYAAASSYYLQASSLWPSSGNPHHQLAILASYSGDELVAIYRYFRSLAVDNPFSTARDNLIIAFEKNRQSYTQLLGDAKVPSTKSMPVRSAGKGRGKGEARPAVKDRKIETSSVKERAVSIPETYKAFCTRFVRLNGILFTRTSLETFSEIFTMVRSDLLELLSSGPEDEFNFGSGASENRLVIVRLVAILIFTVHNVNRETENQSYAEILQRSVLLQNAFTATFEFMGLILERSLSLQDPTSSCLLPGVLVFVEWLACHPDIAAGNDMEEKQVNARSSFWKHCIPFLNKLLSSGLLSTTENDEENCFYNMSRYEEGETANRLALWEDFELRGFLPLVPAQVILDFSRKQSFGGDGGIKEREARLQRIIAAGKALVNVVRVGQQAVYFDHKFKKFAFGVEPQISDEFLLTASELPEVNGMIEEQAASNKMNADAMCVKLQLTVEGDEEEEEIVFKPPVMDKHTDVIVSNLSSFDIQRPAATVYKGDLGSFVEPVSAPQNGILLQNAFNTNFRPTTLTGDVPKHLDPVQPSAPKWLVDQQASIADGLNNLSFSESGLGVKSDLQNQIFQHNALSLPFPQSINYTAGSVLSTQVPESVIPSRFDLVMSSGANMDSLPLKPTLPLSAASKRNPVSRPIRHHGPPPGFSPFPGKHVEEPLSGVIRKSENLPMDDYSWLDGYQMPSTMQGMGFSSSMNHPGQTIQNVNKGNNLGGLSFPFPGKQVPGLQVQVGNQKGWQDYQFSDNLSVYQEQQQQQLQKGNLQSIPLPEQYQGQSLWEGRFFV
ncbi:Telomerase activating protein Est1-like, N-terminal [Dillenia turbinata]|uniref:Telomerase activating protein Est1-like, N-terminal n=1 Tax=Dillenia turbinata TaxID=194707 RepID=A0AAN8ZLF6_9MAGN